MKVHSNIFVAEAFDQETEEQFRNRIYGKCSFQNSSNGKSDKGFSIIYILIQLFGVNARDSPTYVMRFTVFPLPIMVHIPQNFAAILAVVVFVTTELD